MLRRRPLFQWRVRSASFRAWLGALVLWATLPGSARATETDQYFAIDKPPRDSLDVLNEKVNRDILGALALVNRRTRWDQYSCQDVAHRVYQRFRISGLHKIELWAENSPRIDRVPSKKDHERFQAHASLYRNERFWDWGLSFGIKATFTVAGVHMGADKLSHFFQSGWKYHQRYRELRREGVPEHEALERLVRYGAQTESGTLGFVTTGVFSFADLEANYQGFLFYRSLCQDEDPRLLKTPEGWRLTRAFDWREYVSPQFDETVNNSAFVPKRWEEVRTHLRRDYCPRLDSETFVEHYRFYAHYPRRPDDFNLRYVRELIDRGEVPRQQDFSLWAACGRSPPDFPRLAAETSGSAGTGTEGLSTLAPRYEAPRFDEALLRPVFELGAGGLQNDGSAWNALLRTRFMVRETVVPEDTWDAVRTPEYLLWASLDGHLALGSSPAGVTVPYADLRFTPVQRRFELNNAATGEELAIGVVLLPTRLTRLLALDRSFGVEASVIGVRGRLGRHFGERRRVGVFGSLALDSPGYKAALHPSDRHAFQGVLATTLAVETGAELLLGTQLRLGLVLGGRVGPGFGWDAGGGGFSAPSDLGAYAEAQVDVTRFSRLFVRGQLEAFHEPGRDRLLSTPVLLGGATFRY
ncbi:hypothetical protein ATI61_112281 [Archangium gephyra]|uniref:Capsule assembly Wzi family protein n=1 Tax=Archangium gephyra TaxID=48 RepID=A0AAC8Q4Q7_9BACT|nr:hypothetical protein [Archangium gephyra]AKJ01023.1 Hypothetical protein AA314_02649 [Archangium gephyra]REG26186.1 hypothetical protein ATI61_112281 [Archangium gephyra]